MKFMKDKHKQIYNEFLSKVNKSVEEFK
jgi:hypothetical protein